MGSLAYIYILCVYIYLVGLIMWPRFACLSVNKVATLPEPKAFYSLCLTLILHDLCHQGCINNVAAFYAQDVATLSTYDLAKWLTHELFVLGRFFASFQMLETPIFIVFFFKKKFQRARKIKDGNSRTCLELCLHFPQHDLQTGLLIKMPLPNFDLFHPFLSLSHPNPYSYCISWVIIS